MLEKEICPAFYASDEAWTDRVRSSLRSLAPEFSATRMVADYERLMYASGVAAR